MRLIDADKIRDKDISGGIVDIFDVLEAPTVEAIPVEWVEKRIKRLNKDMRENKRHGNGQIIKWQEWELNGLKDMLEDWRKEND